MRALSSNVLPIPDVCPAPNKRACEQARDKCVEDRAPQANEVSAERSRHRLLCAGSAAAQDGLLNCLKNLFPFQYKVGPIISSERIKINSSVVSSIVIHKILTIFK